MNRFKQPFFILYLGVQEANTLTGIYQLLLSHFAASLCLLQGSSQLLNLSHHKAVPALHHGSLLLHVFLSSDSIIKVQLSILVDREMCGVCYTSLV